MSGTQPPHQGAAPVANSRAHARLGGIATDALCERRRSSAAASTSKPAGRPRPVSWPRAQEQGAAGGGADPVADYRRLAGELEAAAAGELAAAMAAPEELTEPFVAYEVARLLPPGDALFVGNSMPIRDMDAFAPAAPAPEGPPGIAAVPQGLGARVAANRGASGIDGVLSTAAGYAFGLGRAVTLVIGDVSFLHDINGLNLLRTGGAHPPVTVVLVNNGGGGIFDFLPIASEVPEETFVELWSTPQNVDLAGMCRAQGIAHQRVGQPGELAPALRAAWGLNKHSVVEVLTSRATNVAQHRALQERVAAAVGAALRARGGGGEPGDLAAAAAAAAAGGGAEGCTVEAARHRRFSLPLAQAVTTGAGARRREGLVLELLLRAGRGGAASGRGEVSPLPGLHAEALAGAEQQVAMLCELLPGCRLPPGFPHTTGGVAGWLEAAVGVGRAAELHPSVLCGLECALTAAAAAATDTPLHALLSGSGGSSGTEQSGSSGGGEEQGVPVNGLLGCQGSPAEAAAAARELVSAGGFSCLKIKVGRRARPEQDAAAVLAVRAAVGPGVALRTDANRAWSFADAATFARLAAPAGLEYCEEPLQAPEQLPQLVADTGLPIALDESLDSLLLGSKGSGPGPALAALLQRVPAAALVLKPAVAGGAGRCLALAEIAAARGVKVVISSAFETSLGLAHSTHLAAAVARLPGQAGTRHGLGTAAWLQQDLAAPPLLPSRTGGEAGISLAAADAALATPLRALRLAGSAPATCEAQRLEVTTQWGQYSFAVARWRGGGGGPPALLLHGFLGGKEDWRPVAAGLAVRGDCFAIDLPAHGGSAVAPATGGTEGGALGVEAVAEAVEALCGALRLPPATALVAYSLGARVALELLRRGRAHFGAVALLSASPGVAPPAERAARAAADDVAAERLRRGGLAPFLEEWYAAPLWGSLRACPRFADMRRRRLGGDANALAAALAAASPGRAPSHWDVLPHLAGRLLLVAGAEDGKYVRLASDVAAAVGSECECEVAVLQGAGHAVHIQRPEAVLRLVAGMLQD